MAGFFKGPYLQSEGFKIGLRGLRVETFFGMCILRSFVHSFIRWCVEAWMEGFEGFVGYCYHILWDLAQEFRCRIDMLELCRMVQIELVEATLHEG